MNYWTATAEYEDKHGGPPRCGRCHKQMYAIDDHGRFACECGETLDVLTERQVDMPDLPQVDIAGMDISEIVRIAPVHRLKSLPTPAEIAVLSYMLRGPDAMNEPGYQAALQALAEERGE